MPTGGGTGVAGRFPKAGDKAFYERGRTWTLTSDAQPASHEGSNDRLLAKGTRDPNARFPERGEEEYVILDRYRRLTDGTYRIVDFMPKGRS